MKQNNLWLYHPRYWLHWLLLGALRLISCLPLSILIRLGGLLGRLIKVTGKRARLTAETNIQLCLPELNPPAQQHLINESFRSVGIGIFELFLSWWASNKRLAKLVHWHGFEHLDKALAAGKGVVIAAPHLTSLELALRFFSLRYSIAVMYNRQKHRWFEHFNQQALHKYYAKAIARENIRTMVKVLKQNMIVCYTPDIDPGHKHGIFVPFFNIPACTVTAVTRLAQMTDAAILCGTFYRREDGSGYDLTILPPLADFPSQQSEQDAKRINEFLEQAVRQHPEQYLWQYKRFKSRPGGAPDPYRC